MIAEFDRVEKEALFFLVGRLGEFCLKDGFETGRGDGKVSATFDIITLTGWAPHESQQKPLKPGEGKVRFEDALKALRKGETS